MKTIRPLLSFLLPLLAAFALVSAPAGADEITPDALIKGVSNDVLAIVRQDKEIQNGNTQRAVQLVEQKVLPHFNFSHMTRLALGRDWNKASPEQQKSLINEFRTLLVRTYSSALTSYKNQNIEFNPFRMQPADTDVVVRTQITQPGNAPIKIDYSLEKLPEGWKVYDITVAGASLVSNYRGTFAQEVNNGGIDGLIKTLQAKNKESGKK